MSTYIKIQNTWTPINRIFKKINGEWVLQNDIISALGDMIYTYGGNTISKLLYIIFNQQQYTGKSFLLTSTYDGNTVYPSWTIISGSQYVTINSNGKVTINEGVTNQTIEVQASYNGETDNKTITVSYDNQLTIESADTITGTSGNVIARYNSTVVTPTWSITSGNQYATIDATGAITITASGTITISAEYTDPNSNSNIYTTTKNIVLVYDSSTSTEVEVNEDGSTTTTVTIVTENQDGSTTETSVVTTTNEDGSTSNTEIETTTNQDGSSETTSTTTSSDGSVSETTSTTSAPDPNTGAVTTQESTSTTNADGTSSESTSTVVANTDGSSTSSSTTNNYDENGDLTGSSENQTTNNSDGSSESTTTNYDENGDPTSQVNNEIDTSGNSSTQDIEYDSNGDPVVTGYSIDTSNNQDGTKEFDGDGVNTEFYGFDATAGFILNFHFTIDFTAQPANQNEGHHNVLTMKRASPSPWHGFQLRQSNNNKYIQLGTQFATGSNTNTTINPTWITTNKVGEYDLTITYNPNASSNRFICRNNLTNSNAYTSNLKFADIDELKYLTICIGYALDENGDPFRYASIDVLDFNVTKLSS